MARIRRVMAVGCPHRITQLGNSRQDLFFDDDARQTYLPLLARHAAARQQRFERGALFLAKGIGQVREEP